MTSAVAVTLRSFGRNVLYRTPLHRLGAWARRRAHAVPQHRSAAYWDAALGGRLKPYLGGTISIDVRNAVTTQLLRAAVPGAKSLLDVGCAAGALVAGARAAGVDRYVGVDISEVAIRAADPTAGTFHVSDLCSFDPSRDGPFDVIVFNEVLYYTEVDEALSEVARYARHLTPHGAVVVSLKNDPKSRAILDGLSSRFDCAGGVLFQEQAGAGRYAVRTDRERPAYLVSVLRPRRTDASTEARR